MTETANLVIKVETHGANKATSDLGKLRSSSRATESTLGGLRKSFGAVSAAVAGVASAFAILKSTIDTARQWEKMRASLQTMTGSAENAALAWEKLNEFAKTTPYNLEQSVEAFTKLVSLGLSPSEEALRSYGNTASAMGKDLSQMIEAVADASTGEFERLKEFGIKAHKQGENVSFTFRGITTTVKNSSEEIQSYLQDIGNNDFAGAMATRMDTLDGVLNNLEDSWNKLTQSMFEGNPSDAVREAAETAIDALDELTALIGSGELLAYINALVDVWEDGFDSMGLTVDGLAEIFGKDMGVMGDIANDFVKFTGESLLTLPQNLAIIWRAKMLVMVKSFNFLSEAGMRLRISLEEMFGDSESVREATLQLANFRIEAAETEHQLHLNALASIENKKAAVANFEEQIKKAKENRAEWEKNRAERLKNIKLEELARQKKLAAAKDAASAAKNKGTSSTSSTGSDDDTGDIQREQIENWLDNLRQQNMTATEINDQWRADELDKVKEYLDEKLLTTEEAEEATHEIRQRWRDKKAELDQQDHDRQVKLQASTLGAYSSILGSMADLTGTFAGKQSNAYKMMFTASKAYSIASTLVSSYDAIAKAWASAPFPYNMPAVATATVETGALNAAVQAVSMGARAHGGQVTGGGLYQGGERGLEAFQDAGGNTMFIPPSDGKVIPNHQLDKVTQGETKSAQAVTVTIINQLDPMLFDSYLSNDEGQNTIINILRRNQTQVREIAG